MTGQEFAILISMPRTLLLILKTLTLIIVAAGLYLGFGSKFFQKYSGPVEKLRLCTATADVISSLVYVASGQNLFTKNGLDAEVSRRTAGVICFQDLIDKKVDVVTIAGFGYVKKSFDNPNTKILASIATTDKNTQIVANKAIILTPGDLKQKRIGVTFGTDAHFFLNAFLVSNNLSLKNVTVSNLQPEELAPALQEGKVDAVITWEPYISDAKKVLKDNAVTWSAQGNQNIYWLVVARKDFTENNPETVRRLVSALYEAEQYTKSNPDQAKNVIAKQINSERVFVDSLWSDYEFSVSLPQSLILSLEDGARWLIDTKSTTQVKVPNYLNYIYFDALEKVKPEAVTIIH